MTMQPAIDRNSLERLIALGRQKGGLTNQDLEEALPVDHMSAEDIALMVVHLEEAGIPVDLDDTLLDRQGRHRSQHMEGAQIVALPGALGRPPCKARKGGVVAECRPGRLRSSPLPRPVRSGRFTGRSSRAFSSCW